MKSIIIACYIHLSTLIQRQLILTIVFIACVNTAYAQRYKTQVTKKLIVNSLASQLKTRTSKHVLSNQGAARLATNQPIFDCTTGKSYLFQGDNDADATTLKSNTSVYMLNLTSGKSTKAHGQLLTGNNTSINNVGFNIKDNYIWGYLRGTNKLVRIGSDWSTQTIAINNLSDDVPFNAGDIDENGIMYLYQGISDGSPASIKRVNLNTLTLLPDITLKLPNSSNRVIRFMIDIAYNPVDHKLYGVDGYTSNKGYNNYDCHLYRIDPATGAATDLGDTDIPDNHYPFGASYFDNSGNLYISQNLTGKIYKIKDVASDGHKARFLRKGPITNDNDGARCFNSPVPVNISGTVFDDANGLVDGIVNGTPVSAIAGNTLYANLVGTNGKVIATTTLTDGTYSFTGLSPNSSFSIVLTNTAGTVGANPPGRTLNGNVVNTGENIGTTAGSDGTPNGIIAVSLTDEDTDDVNFGLDKIPDADSKTAVNQGNPGGSNKVDVPVLTGSDLEDGTYDGVSKTNTVIIQSLPNNATLYYNGSLVSLGQVITNYDPSRLMVDPNDGLITVVFTYSERDAAGQDSPAATVTMPFTLLPDLTPIIYARPSTVYGTTITSVVVDVLELKGAATSGLITVKVTRDALVNLNFPPTASTVGGRSVQNSDWSFDDSDPGYYVLSTNRVIAAGDQLSFGFDGELIPGGTSGTLTISSVIVGGSGGEVKVTNNTDADKIDYFQQ